LASTRLSLTYRSIDSRLRKKKGEAQANIEKSVAKYKVLLEGTNAPH
jgi:hypothetical protein